MPLSKRVPNRRNVPLMMTLPPDELDRLRTFAAKAGRPMSWVARDALRLYLDALERSPAALARVRVSVTDAGKTTPPRWGRPPKAKPTANVR